MTPEQRARQHIDQQLAQTGWAVQDMDQMNLTLPAIAVREFHLKTGFADYVLFVDGQAIGAVEQFREIAEELGEDEFLET